MLERAMAATNGDRKESVVVGEDIRFPGDLLGEQHHTFGVEQLLIGQGLAVCSGELLDAISDERIRQNHVLDEMARMELFSQRDESVEDRGADQAADRLREEKHHHEARDQMRLPAACCW